MEPERISVSLEEFLAFGVADLGTLTVDFGFDISFNFYVDAGETFVEFNEIVGSVEVAQLADNFVAGEAREEAGRCGLVTEVAEND